MSTETVPKQRVQRIDQSPMNPLVWVFQLACGHDIVKTSKSRPKNYSLHKVPGDVLQGPRFERCHKCEAVAKDSAAPTSES